MAKRIETSVDNGHDHYGYHDETGFGMTDETNGHKHQITEFRILKSQGHIHTIKER